MNSPTSAPPRPRPTRRASQARAVSYPEPLAVLLVRTGAIGGQRFPIRKSLSTLGSGRSCDVVLSDPSIKPSHARLELRQGIWFLTPLGVASPTRIDGEPTGTEAPLSPGSLVVLGEVTLLFEPRDRAGAEPSSTRRNRGRGGEGGGRGWRFVRRVVIVLAILAGAMLLLTLEAAGFSR